MLPLDSTLRDRLARIHTGSLSDALNSLGVLAAPIRAITPGARLVGPAFTVKCYPGSIITVHGIKRFRSPNARRRSSTETRDSSARSAKENCSSIS